MRWHAWYLEEYQSAQQSEVQLNNEQLAWREFWNQILSGLAWLG
jgi:hypothetical protein